MPAIDPDSNAPDSNLPMDVTELRLGVRSIFAHRICYFGINRIQQDTLNDILEAYLRKLLWICYIVYNDMCSFSLAGHYKHIHLA